MSLAIETRGLVKKFGCIEAVAGVDLHIPKGSVYAFLGQNGAGKSTTIRLLLGLLRPTAGSVHVLGHDIARDRIAAARAVGSVVETPALYARLTGRENLELTRRLLGAKRSETDRVLEIVDLRSAADRLAGGYSLGMRQRLGLARAMLGQPRILVLDEPTNGLDPDGMRAMRQLIRSLPQQDGVTVLVSSHLLNEVEHFATHVGLINEGRLLAQDTLAALKLEANGNRMYAIVDDAEAAAQALTRRGFEARAAGPDRIEVPLPETSERKAFLARTNRDLVELGFAVSELTCPEPSLEDLYLRLISSRPSGRVPLSPHT